MLRRRIFPHCRCWLLMSSSQTSSGNSFNENDNFNDNDNDNFNGNDNKNFNGNNNNFNENGNNNFNNNDNNNFNENFNNNFKDSGNNNFNDNDNNNFNVNDNNNFNFRKSLQKYDFFNNTLQIQCPCKASTVQKISQFVVSHFWGTYIFLNFKYFAPKSCFDDAILHFRKAMGAEGTFSIHLKLLLSLFCYYPNFEFQRNILCYQDKENTCQKIKYAVVIILLLRVLKSLPNQI